MKVNRIDHVCIAVRDLAQARKTWEPLLGKSQPDETYIDEAERINVARYWVGEVGFELMESTSADGEVARFIAQRGEGVMLLSFNVDNTRQAVAQLQGQGFPFIPAPGGEAGHQAGHQAGEVVRPFREGEYAFIHPARMNGVLTEIIDDKGKGPGK